VHIKYVEVGNFRKLHAVRIDFADQTTVLVGANNSGKTSAMAALRRFLVDRADFSINDFTLANWSKLDHAAAEWQKQAAGGQATAFDWGTVLPHLDVWLHVPTDQLHHIQKILPTLDWDGSNVGVRLRLEPKDVESLKRDYLAARVSAAAVMMAARPEASVAEEGGDVTKRDAFALWPKSFTDFLSRRLRSTFDVRAYLLDPAHLIPPKDGEAFPQALPPESEPIVGDPFKGLIRIDEISAQRGFGSAAGSLVGEEEGDDNVVRSKKLSRQLRSYYAQHLDPFDQPEPKDLEALQALHAAQATFGSRMATSFADALKELEEIGYPGITDPKLTISTNLKPVDGLNHASAVQYEVPTHLSAPGCAHRLPEDTNGLGYQNLVSIVFALMSFRDKWMRRGKASKAAGAGEGLIPPLHLVMIEEPEAHLHAQVQQVFIKQAYRILRKNDALMDSEDLRTQLVVSTHSSHVAHETEFASLRYFRRLPVKTVEGAVPVASVVNLSQVFGPEDQTQRFVKRYLRVTHCDLLFADAAVLVEGPAERILVPHFVHKRSDYEYLRSRYITWLEIGGSHAHRLKSLLMHLGINALIITDLDAKDASHKSVPPKRSAGLTTRNETLRTWIPKEPSLDALLDKNAADLAWTDSTGYSLRVAYQQPVQVVFKSAEPVEAIANTFEDALLYENIEALASMEGAGLLGRLRRALENAKDIEELSQEVAQALALGGKAEFSMDLLDSDEIDTLKIPAYIHNGLLWLVAELRRKEAEIDGKLQQPGNPLKDAITTVAGEAA